MSTSSSSHHHVVLELLREAAALREAALRSVLAEQNFPEEVVGRAVALALHHYRSWIDALERVARTADGGAGQTTTRQGLVCVDCPPTRRGERNETLRVEFPVRYTIFGSADSSDIDTVVWTPPEVWRNLERPDKILLCSEVNHLVIASLALATSRTDDGISLPMPRDVDTNVVCADPSTGFMLGVTKGDTSETSSAVLSTMQLHEQVGCTPSSCPLRLPVEFNVGHKVLRVARTTLSMATDRGSELGKRVRKGLGVNSVLGDMLQLLQDLDLVRAVNERDSNRALIELERLLLTPTQVGAHAAVSAAGMSLEEWTTALRDSTWPWQQLSEQEQDMGGRGADLAKKSAFYLASGLGMMRGKPLFTKQAACAAYPQVATLIRRQPHSPKDLQALEDLKGDFIREARRLPHLDRNADYFESLAVVPKLLRVAVVGAGSISREFALHHFGPATGTVVVSVVDVNEQLALSLSRDVGSVRAGATVINRGARSYSATASESRGTPVPHTARLRDALSDCDVVYIGTPPNSHAALAVEALAAGKHVLLEKPLAATPEDADTIVTAVEADRPGRGPIYLGLDIGMRWNPALAEMRRLALGPSATLGRILRGRLSLHFRAWPRDWQKQIWCKERAEGGPLREVGTHFFFGLMELFGPCCVRRVRCLVKFPELDSVGSETSATGELELNSGVVVSLSLRTDLDKESDGDVYELEIEGEKGCLLLENFSQLRRKLTTATSPTYEWVVEDGSYGRRECIEALVSAAAGGENRGITAREGRNAQRLLDAIFQSGGEWLNVSYD